MRIVFRRNGLLQSINSDTNDFIVRRVGSNGFGIFVISGASAIATSINDRLESYPFEVGSEAHIEKLFMSIHNAIADKKDTFHLDKENES